MSDPIAVDELRILLAEGRPVTVLDVRDAEDRAQWEIPGSVHADLYDALSKGDTSGLDGLDLPQGRPVVAVCYRGNTSRLAAQRLRARGFEARSLAGGMQAWSLAWNAAELRVGEASVVQLRRTGKGCLSYIVGRDQEAVVVDPSLPPEVYREAATARGWRIRLVVDTHVHADHVSRAVAASR